VVNIGNQQQVNVISMEDDEFSTDDEHVSSLFCQLTAHVHYVV